MALVRALNMLAFLPLASRAPIYGRLLLALAADPRVPLSSKALLGLAAAYVVSPVDVIPDWVPLAGKVDDVAVVVLAVDAFLKAVPDGVVREKLDALDIDPMQLERDLERVRRTVPRPVRAAIAALPRAIDGIVEFAGQHGLGRRLRRLPTEDRPA